MIFKELIFFSFITLQCFHCFAVSVGPVDCPPNTIACSDDTCVPKDLRCNGRRDCPNGEDELNCHPTHCSPDHLQCKYSKQCIPIGWKCDGESDCPITDDGIDNTDEDPEFCHGMSGLSEQKCPPHKFECFDHKDCLNLRSVCDGYADCHDASDEGTFCFDQTECAPIQKKCNTGCIVTPNGALCICDQGYINNNNTCIDEDECKNTGTCEHECTNTVGSFKCKCKNGYEVDDGDQSRCKGINVPKDEPATMFISTASQIRQFHLRGIEIDNEDVGHFRIKHLDMNHRNNTVCALMKDVNAPHETSLQCFKSWNMSKSWTLPVASKYTLKDVNMFAYDWIAGNWYLVDPLREVIQVCREDLSLCVVLHESNLSKPTCVALDPNERYMFFSKWGRSPAAIERSNLDGKNRIVLVNHKVTFPNSITLDLVLRHVYWIDNYSDQIDRMDYSGSNRVNFHKESHIITVKGLFIFEKWLYVMTSTKIMAIEKFKHETITWINGTYGTSAVIYHRQKQPGTIHPCQTQNGGCEGVCLAMYTNSTAYPECLCPTGHKLVGGACAPEPLPPVFLVLLQESRIKLLPLHLPISKPLAIVLQTVRLTALSLDAPRSHIYFTENHRNRTVLRRLLVTTLKIDNVLEIPDPVFSMSVDPIGMNVFWTNNHDQISVTSLSDKSLTRTLIATSTTSLTVDNKNGFIYWCSYQLKGDVSKIERAWFDGTHREVLLESRSRTFSNLVVMDSIIIYLDIKRDNIYRYNILANTSELVGPSIQLITMGGGSMTVSTNHIYWVSNTAVYRLPLNAVKAKNNEMVYEEFSSTSVIALYNQTMPPAGGACSNNNGGCDEFCLTTPDGFQCACQNGYKLNGTQCILESPVSGSCKKKQFKCKNGRCIEDNYHCDGHDDCKDGSDEYNCGSMKCLDGNFRCGNSHCISASWVCDGDPDCSDGSDEEESRCKNVTCGPQEFVCKKSGRCIPVAWTCDESLDCGADDTSDEGDICNRSSCPPAHFVCTEGRCLHLKYVCDGDADCRDGSDERGCPAPCNSTTEWQCLRDMMCIPLSARCDGYSNCTDQSDEDGCQLNTNLNSPHTNTATTLNCEPSEFKCSSNLECIRKEFVCDGRKDCFDGSDEVHCATNCTSGNCTTPARAPTPPHLPLCELPSRLCDNNTICVHVEDLCDDRMNCKDGSDEGGRCGQQLCDLGHSCSHFCHNAPEGMVCYCPGGMRLKPNSTECSDPCDTWGACSQTCHVNNHRAKCGCVPGYHLERDLYTCKSTVRVAPLLIFSNRHELRGVDLHTSNFSAKALVFSLKNTIALDFYHGPVDMVYWTDVIDDKIYRGSLIGGSLTNIQVVVQTGLSTAEGLAVDWIGGNLYWVESNLDQIEVAKLNGSFRRTLIAGQMESPRAIALDPRVGLVFWTDWDTSSPRIERCSMAGGHRKLVVQVDELTDGAWPNGLTLDYVAERIYWIDARSDSIHTTTYDGQEPHEVMRGHETLSHPFAIGLFENFVYWTDWRTNSVIRANKWNGTQLRVIQRTLTQPFDIQILHPSRQPRNLKKPSPCEIMNGGCSHLCLIDIEQSYKCNCPHVMRLDKDNKTCVVVNERILIFSRPNEIRGVDLEMPYFHTIPTISSPQVLAPSSLDFYAEQSRLFWVDPHTSEVKSSSLQGGPAETLIDTGISRPTGLAIDWISGNLFLSVFKPSGSHISVSNLRGEYIRRLINTSDLAQLTSIALDPIDAWLFWSGESGKGISCIERSRMDGSDRTTLVSRRDTSDLDGPQSLMYDGEAKKLFWVSTNSKTIQSIPTDEDVTKLRVTTFHLSSQPNTLVPYKGVIYVSYHDDQAVHQIDQLTGKNHSILRNNTGVLHAMRIYDAELQNNKSNACTMNKEKCHHLCLPLSKTDRNCICATGYTQDPTNHTQCLGLPEIILYTINWELKAVSIDGDKNERTEAVLGPLSRIGFATHLASLASQDMILWAEGELGRISKIHRDGTGRSFILDRPEINEAPGDLTGGIAVDWIAGNIYWTYPKMGVIEVARLNGSSRYVVVKMAGRLGSIAVDPIAGSMFWVLNGPSVGVITARLDGSYRRGLFNLPSFNEISDITLDIENKQLYWCDAKQKQIGRINYDGSQKTILLNSTLENPVSLVAHAGYLFWIDNVKHHGSITKALMKNLNNQTLLLMEIGNVTRDIEIFSMARELGNNPCRRSPCEGLCLFNGTHPVCACAHGRVGPDGVSCIDYNEFLMYSRVTQIDSIHMTDEMNLNAPFAPIEHREFMRNAIGLTYDYRRSLIFYSDIQRGSINSVHFNGTNHTVLVERQGSVEGIAYDPYEQALYWTCNNYATISKMNLRRYKINSSEPIETVVKLYRDDKPRGIVVNPCHSELYWTNWNTHLPSIQRSFINGFNLESIVTTDIKMPNAITLDFPTMKLYWGDARLDKIERCDLDGSNRVVLTGLAPQHPFDLAVFEDYLFWTDWLLHSVMRANKYTGEDIHALRKDVPRLMGIVAVHNDQTKCLPNPCEKLNGGCEDRCSINDYGGAQCHCSTDRSVDPKNPTRCISTQELAFNTSYFQCSSGSLIPYELTCDGLAHCEDNSDETITYCGTRTCLVGYHQCPNGRCINSSHVCDNKNDCGDMSDEVNCSSNSSTHFMCSDGKFIQNSFRCDRDPDCQDVSDEMNCPARNCEDMNQHLFLGEEILQFVNCNHTTACILPRWVCDGQNDCWDNSDEQNCPEASQMPESKCANQFSCKDGLCIPLTWVCDGEHDCEDGSDENDCPTVGCYLHQFKCNSSECIPITWRCDITPDCADGSDESTTECANTVCRDVDFRCNTTGRCIPFTWVCDGEADCNDTSDEHPSCLPLPDACAAGDFFCFNRRCISQDMFCDGDDDCGDNSDEPSSCEKQPKCTNGQFQCELGMCIQSSEVCDGVVHCPDSSDEDVQHCSDALQFKCPASTHFRCENSLCINGTLTCNGRDDCGDFSDETLCNVDECSLGSPCSTSQTCVDKKIGYECQCLPGLRVDSEDKTRCLDINECDEERPCSHFCFNSFGAFHCGCPLNYTLKADQRSCKANSSIEPRIIYTNRYYIREFEYRTGANSIIAHNLTNAVGLDYDYLEECLYWSDVAALGSSIRRMCRKNTNGTQEVLHFHTVQNPDGIAVDWIGRNLYWCDKGLDTIEVSKLNGQYRRVLISTNLMEPRAITLNPFEGAMYWTDWGDNPYIGKASMNGSNFRIIVNEGLVWPNALTISYDSKELFYADAKEDYIAVCNLEGNHRKILISRELYPNALLHHIFAMTVFEENIFWTDWELKSIVKCPKVGVKTCENITHSVHRPMDIQVYHPLRQRQLPDNPCNDNGNCSTLCLLTEGDIGKVCACPDNFILGPDGTSCIANCSAAKFVCASSYKCIPFWWKCDTQNDCGDLSDEPDHCGNFSCRPGEFQCDKTKCLHPSQICDGVKDCFDQLDESDCNNYECLNSHFKCSGNRTIPARCIPLGQRCDGRVDCLINQEDEKDCAPVSCKGSQSSQFVCKNDSSCIPIVWVCDGTADCSDGSDEGKDCINRSCPSDYFKCNGGQCIPMSWKCDGDRDCRGGDDESEICSSPDEHVCQPTYFKCDNHKCIPGRWHCDYANDCGDNSDEFNCTMRSCSESEFRCLSSGKCVAGNAVCDGRFQCSDQSDEMNCNITCTDDQFKCESPKRCIYKSWQCDGEADCFDGSDEFNCSTSCRPGQFTCRNKQCIDKSWVCDGEADCSDGSDEESNECHQTNCPRWKYRCPQLKCIPKASLCDGISDCTDSSDESKDVCTRERKCLSSEFRCKVSGECIAKELSCDGYENCVDGSDERDCDWKRVSTCEAAHNCSSVTTCLTGLCSQICVVKKNHFHCQCAPGYTLTYNPDKPGKKPTQLDKNGGKSVHDSYTCSAVGEEPMIVLAAEADLHIMGFYSPRDIKVVSNGASVKSQSIDFFYTEDNTTLFFVDHLQKQILSFVLLKTDWMTAKVKRSIDDWENTVDLPVIERFERSTMPQVLSTPLSDPRGIAVDWVTQRLYVIDKDKGSATSDIVVMTLDGRKKTTILRNLVDAWDIVVNPEHGILVFADRNSEMPVIECSALDGSRRLRLVHRNLVWPVGLAIDIPSARLFFADGKRRVVESIGLDGEKRNIVARLDRSGPMPFKLDVFEDSVLVSMYQSDLLVRLNKFGVGNTIRAQHRLHTRVSEVLIMQSAKQAGGPPNVCDNKACHDYALCVMGPFVDGLPQPKCLCPDGLDPVTDSRNSSQMMCRFAPKKCDLACQHGKCEIISSVPKCVCDASFSGDLCNKYNCSQYCLNGGVCSIGRFSKNHFGLMRCHCPPDFTGQRCETPLQCSGPCLNGGSCRSSHGAPAYCACVGSYIGARCENCRDHFCENEGICSRSAKQFECLCQRGFRGPKCENSVCEGYCTTGNCTVEDGAPVCHCPSDRSGMKCDRDACQGYCDYGGTCLIVNNKRVCHCPPNRTGPRCTMTKLCGRDFCLNGGSCVENGYHSECKCPEGWMGEYCDEASSCTSPNALCFNGGTCVINNAAPHCICPPDFYGKRCESNQAGSTVNQGEIADSSLGVTADVLIAISIFLFVVVAIASAFYLITRFRRNNSFGHVRMSENVEMNNPMYLQGEEMDETDDLPGPVASDRNPNNFANPVYETLYNGGEEKKNLLSAVVEEPLPLDNDSV